MTTKNSIDLRGVPCPLSFVRAKLRLEKIESGQVLEVLLDGGEAIEQVPNSLMVEGHKIQGIEEHDSEAAVGIRFFALTVQKA